MGKALKEWIRALIGAIIFVLLLNLVIGTTTVMHSSMYPTLQERDMILLSRFSSIQRGDIVTFKSDLVITEYDREGLGPFKKLFIRLGTPKILIKRVIGLPGEQVDIQDGKVYINGILLDESAYLGVATMGELHIDRIPDDEFFLLGDNRDISVDSRNTSVGLVSKSDITGKAILRYFPLKRFTFFKEVF